MMPDFIYIKYQYNNFFWIVKKLKNQIQKLKKL